MEQLLALGVISGGLLSYIYEFVKPWLTSLSKKERFALFLFLDFAAAIGITVWQGNWSWSNSVATLVAVFAAAETVYQKFIKNIEADL